MSKNYLPTLEKFLTTDYPKNSYINHKNFSSLYVRKGFFQIKETINGAVIFKFPFTLQIANIQSKKIGRGYFKNLIVELEEIFKQLKLINIPLIIENVFNEKFALGLEKMKFIKFNIDTGYRELASFYKIMNIQEETQPSRIGSPSNLLILEKESIPSKLIEALKIAVDDFSD